MALQAFSRPLLWLVCLACVLASGCGGPNVAKVTGRVTYGGKPVTGGKIMFYPEAGRMALGNINSDGTYSLTTFKPDDGALIGAHRVAIESTRVGAASYEMPKSIEEEMEQSRKSSWKGKIQVPGKVEWVVPEKYARPESSGLTANVGRADNEINFELPAGK